MLKYRIIRNLTIIIAVILVIGIIIVYPKKDEYYPIVATNLNTVYVFDNNNYVSLVKVKLNSNNIKDNIIELFNILSNSDKLRDGFSSPIPKNTKLISFSLDNKTLTLNFSNDINKINKNLEEKMYEAIIYTYTSLDEVDNLEIKIDGIKINKLKHNDIYLKDKLDRSFKINKEYDMYDLKDVNIITVFYPAKLNDYSYFIPVTKYTSNNKDKLEIIIDELKSSSTYNTNLISYLNEDTKLIDSKQVDKSLILSFNDAIFSDLVSSNVKEEITFSINSSVQESLPDIKNILYYVNNYIIDNYFLPLG